MKIDELRDSLKNNGYIVNVFDTIEQANNYLKQSLNNSTIGIGGSMTIEEMGLYDVLSKNNKVYWHWKKDSLQDAVNTDAYLSSVNAISLKGEIVNIDGNCNRIASTLYGHKKVIFVFGTNKIADNLDLAIYRARNVAAVKNAVRLNVKTPCVKTGKCMDCNSSERICKGLSVLLKKPNGCEYEIVIVKQDLGY